MTGLDGFVWKVEPWGRSLRSATLAASADHLFTTGQLRLRGAGEAGEWSMVAGTLGLDASRLARLKQVHGREAVVLGRGDQIPWDGASRPHADILATDDPSLAIAVQVADCVPLLMAGPGGRVVAAVHAGWRGTCASAGPAGVETLQRTFGVKPADLIVAIGPSIGPCCYAVGPEVLERFEAAGSGSARWFHRDREGVLRLDLWAANTDQLEAAGVPRASIGVARLCTACHPGLFHSYRRDGPGTGRIAAAIRARTAAA
jgi:YfiH family protein